MAVQTLNKLISTPVNTYLFYGKTGSGKTHLGARAAMLDAFAPVEIIDFDLRLEGLLQSLSKELLERIRFQSYRDVATPGEAYDRAWSRLRELESIGGKPEAPRTVFLDSLTFMGKSFLDMVVYLDSSKGGDKVNKKDRYGESIAVRDHYGPQMQHIERFIQRLTGLKQKGYNVFASAHEDVTKDELTGTLSKAVDTTGKLVNRLPGYFNEYWHTEIEASPVVGAPVKFIVRTQPTSTIEARTTFTGVLGSTEQQEEIWQKITNHLYTKRP